VLVKIEKHGVTANRGSQNVETRNVQLKGVLLKMEGAGLSLVS